MEQILKALCYLHSHGLAHRDLKTENIMVSEMTRIKGELKIGVKLIDFGFAYALHGQEMTDLLGSPNYVAPEILQERPYDHKCDIWSLGIVVYELFSQ